MDDADCLSDLLARVCVSVRLSVQGYTAMHVAAQYGATALLWHLVHRWEADWDSLDSSGRTP